MNEVNTELNHLSFHCTIQESYFTMVHITKDHQKVSSKKETLLVYQVDIQVKQLSHLNSPSEIKPSTARSTTDRWRHYTPWSGQLLSQYDIRRVKLNTPLLCRSCVFIQKMADGMRWREIEWLVFRKQMKCLVIIYVFRVRFWRLFSDTFF